MLSDPVRFVVAVIACLVAVTGKSNAGTVTSQGSHSSGSIGDGRHEERHVEFSSTHEGEVRPEFVNQPPADGSDSLGFRGSFNRGGRPSGGVGAGNQGPVTPGPDGVLRPRFPMPTFNFPSSFSQNPGHGTQGFSSQVTSFRSGFDQNQPPPQMTSGASTLVPFGSALQQTLQAQVQQILNQL